VDGKNFKVQQNSKTKNSGKKVVESVEFCTQMTQIKQMSTESVKVSKICVICVLSTSGQHPNSPRAI